MATVSGPQLLDLLKRLEQIKIGENDRILNKDIFERYDEILGLHYLIVEDTLNFGRDLAVKTDAQLSLSGNDIAIFQNLFRIYKIYLASHSKFSYLVESSDESSGLPNNLQQLYLASIKASLFHLISHVHDQFFENRVIRQMVAEIIGKNEKRDRDENIFLSSIFDVTNIRSRTQLYQQLTSLSICSVSKNELDSNERIIEKSCNIIHTLIKSKAMLKKYADDWPNDRAYRRLSKLSFTISRLFGNFVGKIRWRKGYLNNKAHIIKYLQDSLLPLDILVEKSGFALTDKLIPGHFGHAALYIGTKQQLLELNLWNHPAIVPYHQNIENGEVILEAVREGVHLTSINDFMNIDELVALRDPHIFQNQEKINSTFQIAFAKIGVDYDFNFDQNSFQKIVCSELISQAMGHIVWPTNFLLGRNSIEPDHITNLLFYENTPVAFLFAIGGEKVRTFSQIEVGEELGFTLNADRSSTNNPYYEKMDGQCRRVQTRRGLRIDPFCKSRKRHYIYSDENYK